MKLFIRFMGVLALCGLTSEALAYKGEKLSKAAKIPMEEARTIAVNRYPGDVTEEELKKAHGGSGLIYMFKIKDSVGVQLVSVDAKSGEILKYRMESYQGK